jgi:hypothetical protein
MKLPVFKAFGASFAVVFGHFGEMLKILWLPLALLLGAGYWFAGQTFRYSRHIMEMQLPGGPVDPHQMMQEVFHELGWTGLILLADIILIPMMFAGILRFIIRGERAKGLFYLRFGGDELRILITFILQALLFCALYIGGIIVIGLLVYGLGYAQMSPSISGLAGLLVGLAFIVFMIWVALRLSLTLPAAVGARKIGIGPSWSVTKGNVWRLLGYWILWGLLFWLIEVVLIMFLMPGYFAGIGQMMQTIMAHPHDPAAAEHAMREWNLQMMTTLGERWSFISGAGFILGLVLYPLFIASGGVAYRLMTEKKDDEVAPAI